MFDINGFLASQGFLAQLATLISALVIGVLQAFLPGGFGT